MRIQIDTTAKTIRVEEQISLGELECELKKLFPGGEWIEYKLEAYSYPIQYPYYPVYYPYYLYREYTPVYSVDTTRVISSSAI